MVSPCFSNDKKESACFLETNEGKIDKVSSSFSKNFGYKSENIESICIYEFLKIQKNEIVKMKDLPFYIQKFEMPSNWGITKEILLIKIKLDLERDLFIFKDNYKKDMLSIHDFNSYIDKTTGLQNRYSFNKELNANKEFYAAYIDLKHYTSIVSYYGEDFSNGILNELSNKIKEHYDISNIFKINEDTFCIIKLQNEYVEIENFTQEIEKKLKKIFGHFFKNKCPISLDYVMGIGYGNGKNIFDNTNMALQYAKEFGLKKCVYDKNLFSRKQELIHKEADMYLKIKAALSEGRVIPYYQPIHNNNKNEIKKYECLARITEPTGELISPSLFIDIAKKHHLSNDITKAMIIKSFEYFKDFKDVTFSINLHFHALMDIEMYHFILNEVSNFPYPENVIFEVVENEAMPLELFESNVLIQHLREKGCKFALDDFGSGYSSLSMLTYFNYDYLKIDGSLISNIDKKEYYNTIKTITKLAHYHNVEIVAEWVKDDNTQRIVKDLNIDYSQGYYFGKPEREILLEEPLK